VYVYGSLILLMWILYLYMIVCETHMHRVYAHTSYTHDVCFAGIRMHMYVDLHKHMSTHTLDTDDDGNSAYHTRWDDAIVYRSTLRHRIVCYGILLLSL
jgi:hypothetical protein